MTELSRRQAIVLGAALTSVGLPSTAHAASPAGDLSLWYDEPAGTDWLRALPVGNGRLGAMVFGGTDTERLQLNEDTLWAGGPHDYTNPGARGRWRRSGGWCSPTSGPRRRTWPTAPCWANPPRSWPTSPWATCGWRSPRRAR
nr:hypothetical protein GCM10017745_40100 [Saccharothrix mutabilis subsp. capreolus]